MHILLVEDHGPSRIVLSKLLIHCGHEVTAAENFQHAVDLLTQSAFDALISDLGLPDRDGLELVSEARKCQSLKLALALTARAKENDRQLAREAGFDHYMTKPFDFFELRSILGAAEKMA